MDKGEYTAFPRFAARGFFNKKHENMKTLFVLIKLLLKKIFVIPSFCKVCGKNVRDFTAPEDVWVRIRPYIKLGSVCCYECFCDLCDKANIRYGGTWRLESTNEG